MTEEGNLGVPNTGEKGELEEERGHRSGHGKERFEHEGKKENWRRNGGIEVDMARKDLNVHRMDEIWGWAG